jgi:rRNA-processing protein FCF1
MKTIVIDTNTLVLYLLCSTNVNYLKSHDRLNAFDKNDFIYIDGILKTFDRVITTPNVWTEVDDLCTNTIKGDDKYIYICIIKKLVNDFIEIYTPTKKLSENHNAFYNLGFADTGLLELSIEHKNLITTDSKLSDFARASNVTVLDLTEYKTQKILSTP